MASEHIGKAAFGKEIEQKQFPHMRSTSTIYDATKETQSMPFVAKNIANQTEIHSASNSKENVKCSKINQSNSRTFHETYNSRC